MPIKESRSVSLHEGAGTNGQGPCDQTDEAAKSLDLAAGDGSPHARMQRRYRPCGKACFERKEIHGDGRRQGASAAQDGLQNRGPGRRPDWKSSTTEIKAG